MELMEMLASKVWTGLASEVLLASVFFKGAILAGGMVLLGLALRRASAATRSTVWSAAFAGLLVLPLLVPLLTAGRVPAVWELGMVEYPSRLFEAGAAATPGGGVPVASWLALGWAIGVALLLGRFALHVVRIRWVSRRARPVRRGPLARIAERIAGELGIRTPRVALSDQPGVPLTWGLARPVILLPLEAAEWSPKLQRAVLHHEMAHVLRRDYMVLVVMELCRAIHWPNPLVWYMVRLARMDQERACDDAAIRSGIAAPEYARHLVEVARSFALGPRRAAGALPILRGSTLKSRVQGVMAGGADRRPATLRTALGSALLVGVLAAPLAVSTPWICPTASAEEIAPPATWPTTKGPTAAGEGWAAAGPPASAGADASALLGRRLSPMVGGPAGEPCPES